MTIKVNILDLRPTQISAGMLEIQHKVTHLNAMSRKQLNAYLKTKVVPVILGPKKVFYIIDHHHHCRAMWEVGKEEVEVKVLADLSRFSLEAFWKTMKVNGWVYPYDQYGNGPYDATKYLPQTIQGLADDPFRSIAWMAREAGAYSKVEAPFVEFEWADFLRVNMKTHPNTHSMKKVMKEAKTLCAGNKAKNLKLPGIKV